MGTTIYGDVILKDILVSVFILLISLLISKLIVFKVRRLFGGKVGKTNIALISKGVFAFFIGTAIVSILSILGINLSGLLVAGGVTGIVIGFASQKVVGNMIAGIFLLLERPIEIGSPVEIDGKTGVVEEISLVSTKMRTFEGLALRVPNDKIVNADIKNFTANKARRFEHKIGIRYSDDAKKAVELISDLLDKHPLVLKNPAPQVFINDLGDSSVDIIVRIWGPTTEWFNIKTETLWEIKCLLEANGMEIPFPQRVMWSVDKT
ncbi:MAG: mechanosensitive ion channel family protein [Candidatus Omnitrophota bacterium]